MKKIYLLLAVGLLAATISASAQSVVLRMDNNYGVSIDGSNIDKDMTLSNLSYGRHTINVYKLSGGILGIGRKRTLVSSSAFELRNNDMTIDVSNLRSGTYFMEISNDKDKTVKKIIKE